MHAIKKQWFSVAIIGCIFIAYLFTQFGFMLDDHIATKIKFSLIIFIFVLSGITINTNRLSESMRQWQTHIFIQLVSFVIFPLVVFTTTYLFMSPVFSSPVYTGFVVLACIPTTITSCVVFTRAAGGNTESALFNATLGNIIGIIFTPFLIYLMISENIYLDPIQAIKKLSILIVLPFIFGQLVRNYLNVNIDTSQTKSINNLMVLGIILLAFIKTFQQGILIDIELLVYILLFSLTLKVLLTAFCWYVSGFFSSTFSLADRKCITLTATPKTLAMGLPLIAILFADNANLAVISLPMICYYTFQLILDSVLIGVMAQMKPFDSKAR